MRPNPAIITCNNNIEQTETKATNMSDRISTCAHDDNNNNNNNNNNNCHDITSSFSSMKLRQPSPGTKAAIFLPFLIS